MEDRRILMLLVKLTSLFWYFVLNNILCLTSGLVKPTRCGFIFINVPAASITSFNSGLPLLTV